MTVTVRVSPPMLTTATSDDSADADGSGVFRPQVFAGGERERDAGGGLADDEAPAGEVSPCGCELTACVDVGATGLGVGGCELGR